MCSQESFLKRLPEKAINGFSYNKEKGRVEYWQAGQLRAYQSEGWFGKEPYKSLGLFSDWVNRVSLQNVSARLRSR